MSHFHHDRKKFLNLHCGAYLKISTEHEVQPWFLFIFFRSEASCFVKSLLVVLSFLDA